MDFEFDMETRLALVDEIKARIPTKEGKRVWYAVAAALKTEALTERSRLSRFLGKEQEAVNQWLGKEAGTVLPAICREFNWDMPELVRAARRAARQRQRNLRVHHRAWIQLESAAPWVDEVPGLGEGLRTLEARIKDFHRPSVIWLTGPAGIGKSARLWLAHEQGLGQLVEQRPDEAENDAVFLVDEPADPEAWISWANRWRARLVIAAQTKTPGRDRGHVSIELGPWTEREVRAFVDRLSDVYVGTLPALDVADLEAVAGTVIALGGTWTPLARGNVVRLLVDEPALVAPPADEREVRIRIALHRLMTRSSHTPFDRRLWDSHGRRAVALASAESVRTAGMDRVAAPVGEADLHGVLSTIAGVSVGGSARESLNAVLQRARRESPRNPLKVLDTWAEQPTPGELVDLLLAVGLWRRDSAGRLEPVDDDLTITLAADELDEGWMWKRLVETLADSSWSLARMRWAARLGHVRVRVDELLASGAATHAGAIELATALVAYAREESRDDQIERVVCSAVQLWCCYPMWKLQLGLRPEVLRGLIRAASRRHRAVLPQLTVNWDAEELARRGTATTRRLVERVNGLATAEQSWLRGSVTPYEVPDWVTYATLLPWQALSLLEAPESKGLLVPFRADWHDVVMDHAADGHRWARAVVTGDVQSLDSVVDLSSARGMMGALCRYDSPSDPGRHERAVARVVSALRRGHGAPTRRLRAQVVRVVAQLVSRHPELPLPHETWLETHEEVWRDGLDRAAAKASLQRWYEGELERLADVVSENELRQAVPMPNRVRPIRGHNERRLDRIVCLAEVLHRHEIRAPLRALLEKTLPQEWPTALDLPWHLGLRAAAALLRQRDAEALRAALHGGQGPAAAVNQVFGGDHDEPTETWIADVVGDRFREFLSRIPGRPERRAYAKRWALDPSQPYRRDAAAVWLLEHPQDDESEHVRWLFDSLPVARSRYHSNAGLAHPDERVQKAAASLLRRALEETKGKGELTNVARCFEHGDGEANDVGALLTMRQYLTDVNASRQTIDGESVRTLITLTERALVEAANGPNWHYFTSWCEALASAACRIRLASLASWVSAPFGIVADAAIDPMRVAEVRRQISDGVFHQSSPVHVEQMVLQVLAAAEDAADPVSVKIDAA